MNSVASFVGIDQGKKALVVYARGLTQNWEKRYRVRYGDWDTLKYCLEQLPKPIMVAVEASYVYYPLVDRLAAWGCDVRLANPRQLKLICKAAKKTDRIDAKKLAKLLVTNDLPESYIPRPEERPDRALLTTREHLFRNRTGLVNHVRAKLRQFELPEPVGDLYSPRAIAEIRKSLEERKVDPSLECSITALLRALEAVHEAMVEVDKVIAAKTEKHPQMKELASIEGIGKVSSFALVRAMGDWGRFEKSRQVGRYTGMTPRTDISSEDARYGRIDREGPPILRRIVNEVVLCARRVNLHVADYWKWMAERKSKKRVRVACARRLIVGLWAAWRHGKKFDYAICFRIPSNN